MDKPRKKNILSLGLVFLGILFLCGTVRPPAAWSWEAKDVIKKYMKTHYPWPEIEIMDLYGDEELPKEAPQKVHLVSGPLGRAVFSLGFRSGEKAMVQAQIRAMDWVVATRRPIIKGQVIENDDIYLSLIDVRRMPKDALTRPEKGVGKIALRNLEINTPVPENFLGDVPVIKKGQRVTLVLSAPGLKITTQGEAREDGHPGRQMRVVNLYSKRDMRGIPLDESRVMVVF
jgi:flagella basal body P-ring formation protein FlgA